MIWVLIGVVGLFAWLSVAGLFLALCHMAGRADELATAGAVRRRRTRTRTARSYFRSRESRRSLSSLPSVWQVGQ